MNLPFTNMQITLVAAALAVVVFIVLIAYKRRRNNKTQAFKDSFGSEYDRAVITHGSTQKAESKLAARENRVDALNIRELGPAERERFLDQWAGVQSRFVDHPKGAVTEADDLINALLLARGYPQNGPQNGFEQRAEDVSVRYPVVMENYRIANGIAVRNSGLEATTEELRTAMIKYRAVFDELIRPTSNLAANAA